MNRLFAVKPLLVVTAALTIALVLACGRGEPTSPGSLLRLLPQNADSFTFADLEQLRDERLDNLEQQLASLIGEGRLDDWEIDLDDASSLVLSDPDSGDALTILRGRFVAEDVEDALDDDGLRDSVHRDVTVWSERSGGVALAFVGEDVIVIGEEERVEDSIDVFIDEARSMEQDDEAEAIVDALEDALVYSVAEDCGYRDCRRQGSAVRVEAGDLVAVFAFLFRNDDAAADAEGDIEDHLEELVDDPRTEADGEMVIAESPVDEDQLGLDRNGALAYRLEGDGSTPGRGGQERPTPAPELPRFADDHGDDRSGATRIRDGEFLDGDIERDGDRDFFFFSAEGGGEYRIETHLGSNSDTVLVLYGPDGDYLDENDDSGEDAASRLEWVAPSSDIYYIEVTGFDGTLGTYQLSLFESGRPTARPPMAQTPPETDREALVALYNATGGPYWDRNDNWLSDVPISEWEGVTTDDNGRVIKLYLDLYLDENQLSGEIPPELGNLSNLTWLVLANNQLSGEIPPELGNLTNLTWLELTSNQLSGEIPPELGNLSNLQQLSLWNNQLSGEIPPELGNLSNLGVLFLGQNQLSGEIPSELGNLSNLVYLTLDGNQLTGCVPSSLSGRLNMDDSRLGVSSSAREAPAHPAYRRVKFTAERTGGEAPCPLCAPQRPQPTGAEPCRPKPKGRRSTLPCWARQSWTVSSATAPKDRWLIRLIPATRRTHLGSTSPPWCCCTTGPNA